MKSFISTLAVCAYCTAGGAAATEPGDLPDISGSFNSVLSQSEEYRIGRMIVHRLREAGQLLEDPEIDEYIQSLGHRLSAQAHDGQHRFEFFVVDDPTINAFALPGGFIGVNAGLIRTTRTESELAGVLAHEVAHVTQRHIARTVQSAGQTSIAATAAIVAAVLIGAVTGVGDDAVQGAIAMAQGYAMQKSIDYTRAHEYEADRVGVGILAAADFDPEGMPDFFETLASRSRTSLSQQVPEFLRTHPVESNRIAETRERAQRLAKGEVLETQHYELMRARLDVLNAEMPSAALTYFEGQARGDILEAAAPLRYGYATALLRAGEPERARLIFSGLLKEHDEVISYHSGLAQAQLAAGDTDAAMKTFAQAIALFPRNVPLTMRYAQALLDLDRAEEAHVLMLDLLNNIQYNPIQIRLIALAASAAGETADAHFYMSEFHVLNGELQLAVNELELALAIPGIQQVQRARYEARMADIRKYLPESRRRRDRDRENSAPG